VTHRRPIVALVCEVVYPYSHGGREIRNQELLPRLAQHVELHVYTMHWWEGPPSYSDNGVTYHAISPLLSLYRNNRRSLRQALIFGFASLRLLRCRFDMLETDQIPYLQVFVLRLVATLKRKPFIVTWHEVWSRAYWCQYLGWAGWIAWLTERLAMRLPDHIIAASPQTAERLAGGLRRRGAAEADLRAAGLRRNEGQGARRGAVEALRRPGGRGARPRPPDARRRGLA